MQSSNNRWLGPKSCTGRNRLLRLAEVFLLLYSISIHRVVQQQIPGILRPCLIRQKALRSIQNLISEISEAISDSFNRRNYWNLMRIKIHVFKEGSCAWAGHASGFA